MTYKITAIDNLTDKTRIFLVNAHNRAEAIEKCKSYVMAVGIYLKTKQPWLVTEMESVELII